MDRGQPRAEVVLWRGGEELARWALIGTGRPDLDLVDEVARLQLAARRLGCTIWLDHACPDLVELLELVGLRPVVGPSGPESGGRRGGRPLQVVGEAEGGEEGGVEEVVMPDDPVA
ncbi:MAG: hypothetical protein M3326_10775 [Actinomycetota bacterium]|nr:hypothetical protein [Actinomycetota bacterium]